MGDPSTSNNDALDGSTATGLTVQHSIVPSGLLVGEDDDEPPSSRPGTGIGVEVNNAKEPVPPDLPAFPGLSSPSTEATINTEAVATSLTPPADVHHHGDSPREFFTRRRQGSGSHITEKDDSVNPIHGHGPLAFASPVSDAPVIGASHPPPTSHHAVMKATTTKGGALRARLTVLFRPTRVLGPPPSYKDSLIAIAKYNYLNFCLAFIPVSWALHYTHQSDTLVFVFSALGIIPLAALLGFGTEQIALRTSDSVGGLLNATLGNVVELIIAGIALAECELELVQSSLLGGLLSNLLLVLGMAFVVGGYRYSSQEFQPMVAQLNSSLMTVSVMALIIPSAFHEYVGDRLAHGQELKVLLMLSRGSAVILIFIYFAYLVFQFYSHSHLFMDTTTISSASTKSSKSPRESFARSNTMDTQILPFPATTNSQSMTILPGNPSVTSFSSRSSEIEYPKLNTQTAMGLLVAVTALTYFTAEFLVESIEGFVESNPSVSKEWLTLIIIPVISNAAEHTTAVVVASKGKFDLAMNVAVGSCIQIALFIIPVLILVGWVMARPLTLLFDTLEILVLFFSVLLVKFAVEDGRSHWMSGTVLVSVYALITLNFWNVPQSARILQGIPLTCEFVSG